MKIFTVDAPLDSGEKKTAIASTQLAMTPAYKVVEKKKKGGSTLLKAALFVVFAFLLAAVLTVVISEYAWKKREGGNLFRMRWEDIRSKFQNRPSTFEAQPIPVQIDDPSPPVPA
uniref:Uncharacterized protein n=1 Tax=Plectus sambesii TaxID=2011161 RepID=A0A914V4J6_9BILA